MLMLTCYHEYSSQMEPFSIDFYKLIMELHLVVSFRGGGEGGGGRRGGGRKGGRGGGEERGGGGVFVLQFTRMTILSCIWCVFIHEIIHWQI